MIIDWQIGNHNSTLFYHSRILGIQGLTAEIVQPPGDGWTLANRPATFTLDDRATTYTLSNRPTAFTLDDRATTFTLPHRPTTWTLEEQ